MGPSKTLSWMDTFFIAVVIVNTLKKAPLPAVAKENWILFLWKKKKALQIFSHLIPLHTIMKNSDLYTRWKYMYMYVQ